MDEKTAMTIEFLRARLLSERTVSRTARQRAELLARRVMELEEQLRIVNIQRKKAEKATEEIVTILETQGITCICGSADSGSEQEVAFCKSSEDIKDNEGFTASRIGESEIEDASSRSDVDGCSSQFKSLSWKSHGTSLETQEKQNARQHRHRQRNSFIFTVKSSQHRPGKSCRKIKRRDARVGEEAGSERDDSMERALEQQAQLIGQFETMENAQREWEEKFQRTEIPMLGVAEPGDQVSITENSYCSEQNAKQIDKVEPRKKEEERLTAEHVPFTDETIAGRCRNCEATNRKVEASDKFQSSNSMPTSPAPNTAFQQYDTIAMNGSNSVSQIFRSPSVGSLGLNSKETDIRGSTYEKPTSIIHTDQKIQPHERVISQTTATVHHDQKIHPNVGKISRWENPAIKTLPKLLDQPKSTSLASVIESLERARVSLGKEIIKRPSLSQGTLPTSAPADSPDIPIGHSGLFRLPTDSFPHALLPRPNVYGSGLRLTATRPDIGFITSEVSTSKGYFDQSPNSSYSEAGYQVPSSRRDYMDGYQVISHMNGKQYVSQYPARYLETGSQFSMAKDYSDRFSTMNLMSPSPRESYLPCSGLPMKRMPLHNELPTIPYTNLRNRMPY